MDSTTIEGVKYGTPMIVSAVGETGGATGVAAVSGRGNSMREVPIPIQGSAWPALKGAFPMTEEAWTQMIAVLNAMKPGLVESKKD